MTRLSEKNTLLPSVSSRRTFLRGLALAIPGVVVSQCMPLASPSISERSLSLYHTHTGEKLTVVYFKGGAYIHEAREKLNFLLRDFRNDKIVSIDFLIFDLLSELSHSLNPGGVFEIISGYRSPETNARLLWRLAG